MTTNSHLLDHLVLFGRYLRALGIPVTPHQVATLAESLAFIDLGNSSDFQAGAQAILVNRQEHIALFQRAFRRFWQSWPADDARDARRLPRWEAARSARLQALVTGGRPADSLPPQEDQDATSDRARTYSAREVLRQKDFGQLTLAELAEVRRLLLATRWKPALRRTRRSVSAARGTQLDMRRTWRHSLRHGGEMLSLRWRRRQRKPRPLVLLCDISGSMERYARIVLQLSYVLGGQARWQTGRQVEVFTFGTRLTRLTRQLRHRHVDRALAEAAAGIEDWGGGTRIGEALKRFNYDWARRVLRQGAVVLIISDGIDRGDIDLLAGEMARLQRSCHRVIWLNPLLGGEGYEPTVRGMQTALPFVDEFLPVHNLVSVEQLAHVLSSRP